MGKRQGRRGFLNKREIFLKKTEKTCFSGLGVIYYTVKVLKRIVFAQGPAGQARASFRLLRSEK
jgi:hypothetical protein